MSVFNIVMELRRRRVFRVAGIYLIGTWAILQVADVVAEPLGLPGWTMVLLIYLAAGGLPLALFLGWRYQLTEDGIVRTKEVSTPEGSANLNLTVIDHAIIGVVGVLFLVLVYGLVTEGVDVTEPTAEESSAALVNSIAVLPFSSLGSRETHLGDGISDTVIHVLSQVKGLNVTARTSSFAFRDKALSVSEIADSLRVKTVLEGSVQQAKERIRIIARLIEAKTGVELWSDKYDSEFSDIFEIQDEIAREVVTAMKISVLDQGKEKLPDQYRPNLAAYEQLILGKTELSKETVAGWTAAEKHFKKAIEIDPKYAMPYVQLSIILQRQVRAKGLNHTEIMQQRRSLLDTALDLDPLLAEAHYELSELLVQEKNFEEAEKALIRTIELSPSFAPAYASYATFYYMIKDSEKALIKARKAVELDPESSRNYLMLGNILWQLNRSEEAIGVIKDSIARQPNYARNYTILARWTTQLGRPGLGMIYTEKLLSLDEDNPESQWGVCLMHYQLWDKKQGQDCVAEFLKRYPNDREAKIYEAMASDDLNDWLEVTRQVHEEEAWSWYRRNQYANVQAYVGDWQGVLETLKESYQKFTAPNATIQDIEIWEARLVAQALQETGQVQQSTTILKLILKHVDRSRKILGGGSSNGIDDVFALALLGRKDEAFKRLAEAIDNKWSFFSWDFEKTPALKSLTGDPRLMQEYQRLSEHMANERIWYEEHKNEPVMSF